MQIKGTAKEVGWALWAFVTHNKVVLARRYQGIFSPSLQKGGHYPPPPPKTREFLVVRRSVSASADASGNVF